MILLWVCVVIFLCDGRVLNGGCRPGTKQWTLAGVKRWKSVRRPAVEVGPSVSEIVGVLL